MSFLNQLRAASHKEILEARLNVSMADVEHLITWLRETGREYLIFKSEDLVRGITLTHVPFLQALLTDYTVYRRGIPDGSGEKLEVRLEDIGEVCYEEVGKTAQLTPAEALEVAQHLLNFVNESHAKKGEPVTWTLVGP